MGLPSLHSLWQCFCDLKTTVANLINQVNNQVDNDQQTLTINGDDLTISNGNTVTITHPTPPAHTICVGPFVKQTARTGWAFGTWSAIFTANTGTVTRDWVPVGAAQTAPNCITDMHVTLDMGELYTQIRRCRFYYWVDWRILINGVAVYTETYDAYNYQDQRTDTNPDVVNPNRLIIMHLKTANGIRLNVPAGATVTIEMRDRYNANAMQTSGRLRFISGLRSQATFVFTPKQIITA